MLVAAARQDRTYLPRRSRCPLFPPTAGHSTEIPARDFRLAVFENRFPSLKAGSAPSRPEAVASAGVCEVVVYGPEHEGGLASLAPDRVGDLAEVWADRYRALGARPDVAYVFIFENRGQAVGVTLSHPHGQIYGYPFTPPVARIEIGAVPLPARSACSWPRKAAPGCECSGAGAAPWPTCRPGPAGPTRSM